MPYFENILVLKSYFANLIFFYCCILCTSLFLDAYEARGQWPVASDFTHPMTPFVLYNQASTPFCHGGGGGVTVK